MDGIEFVCFLIVFVVGCVIGACGHERDIERGCILNNETALWNGLTFKCEIKK